MGMNIPVRHVAWKSCWRIIPTRYPEERLLDRVTDPGDRDAVEQLEQMTNERMRQDRDEVSHVPPAERVTGPGSTYIMAPFTYMNPEGSRFSDGSFGVYYTAHEIETAVAESRFHREKFMRRTKEPPMQLQMRALTATLRADLHDIMGMAKKLPKVYSLTSYSTSQELGVKLRKDGSEGIVYDSIRHEGGECAAVFIPTGLSNCHPERQLIYQWDGKQIATTFELKEIPRE
jgi:hypothetical protein